jgi:hypothetical protein
VETTPLGLSAEYWSERAERLRQTADFVDEKARETLLKIAGNYESLARRAKARERIEELVS